MWFVNVNSLPVLFMSIYIRLKENLLNFEVMSCVDLVLVLYVELWVLMHF